MNVFPRAEESRSGFVSEEIIAWADNFVVEGAEQAFKNKKCTLITDEKQCFFGTIKSLPFINPLLWPCSRWPFLRERKREREKRERVRERESEREREKA